MQFDDEDVGKKTRQENRRLYVQGIQATWTPIKAITSQFAVGRIKSAQVVRKQFPLRQAAAKTVHRSQGDTQSQIVVNLDTNFMSADLAIFLETRFGPFDDDNMYSIDGFKLFRNDGDMTHHSSGRPYGGTAVYSRVPFLKGYPCRRNINGIEFTVIKITTRQELTIIGVYHSPRIASSLLCSALIDVIAQVTSKQNIIIGDFNIDWMAENQRQPLYNIMVRDNRYRQLISMYTTDNHSIIDHIYTNIAGTVNSGILEIYFSDHKAVWISH